MCSTIECECGSSMLKSSYKRHQKTIIHRKKLEELENYTMELQIAFQQLVLPLIRGESISGQSVISSLHERFLDVQCYCDECVGRPKSCYDCGVCEKCKEWNTSSEWSESEEDDWCEVGEHQVSKDDKWENFADCKNCVSEKEYKEQMEEDEEDDMPLWDQASIWIPMEHTSAQRQVNEEIRAEVMRAKCGHYHQNKRDIGKMYNCWDCDMNDIDSDEDSQDGYCEGDCGKKEIWDMSERNMCKRCELCVYDCVGCLESMKDRKSICIKCWAECWVDEKSFFENLHLE